MVYCRRGGGSGISSRQRARAPSDARPAGTPAGQGGKAPRRPESSWAGWSWGRGRREGKGGRRSRHAGRGRGPAAAGARPPRRGRHRPKTPGSHLHVPAGTLEVTESPRNQFMAALATLAGTSCPPLNTTYLEGGAREGKAGCGRRGAEARGVEMAGPGRWAGGTGCGGCRVGGRVLRPPPDAPAAAPWRWLAGHRRKHKGRQKQWLT